jgi:circadian clock protein KaiB
MANDVPRPPTSVRLRLFIVGNEPHSLRARENIERILAEGHFGHYHLEVVDVLTNYREALDNSILVAPTLVITTAGNARITVAGDMSDSGKIKSALEML